MRALSGMLCSFYEKMCKMPVIMPDIQYILKNSTPSYIQGVSVITVSVPLKSPSERNLILTYVFEFVSVPI